MMMIPPGWSFSPSDEEILEILAAITDDKGVGFSPINLVDIYEAEPWKFAGCYNRDHVGYFYTGRRCIGAGTKNVNRIAGEGKWHGYGHPKDIKSSTGQMLGHKITGLSFRTLTKERWSSGFGDWVMREYLLPRPGFQSHSLCKIYRKQPLKHGEPEIELQTRGRRSLKRPRSVDVVDSPTCSAYGTQYPQDCTQYPQDLERPGGDEVGGDVPRVSQEWDSEAMDDLFLSFD